MQRNNRILAAATLAAFIATSIAGPLAARASEEGKRNTTIGLGAASAALLLSQKNKLPGLVAAGGTVYAYSQYQHDIDKRHRRAQAASYRHGYARGSYYARHHRHVARR